LRTGACPNENCLDSNGTKKMTGEIEAEGQDGGRTGKNSMGEKRSEATLFRKGKPNQMAPSKRGGKDKSLRGRNCPEQKKGTASRAHLARSRGKGVGKQISPVLGEKGVGILLP